MAARRGGKGRAAAALRHLPAPRAGGGRGKEPLPPRRGGPGPRAAARRGLFLSLGSAVGAVASLRERRRLRADSGAQGSPPRCQRPEDCEGGEGTARRVGLGLLHRCAMEASPIVTSKQREEVVHGVPTEVVCTAFSNSVLVVVTQYGKMGTIVYVDPNTIGDNVGRPSLTTKVLLGKDEPLVHVCAKNLVAFVSQEAGNKPVVLAMALKDKTMEGIQALREVIRSCQVW